MLYAMAGIATGLFLASIPGFRERTLDMIGLLVGYVVVGAIWLVLQMSKPGARQRENELFGGIALCAAVVGVGVPLNPLVAPGAPLASFLALAVACVLLIGSLVLSADGSRPRREVVLSSVLVSALFGSMAATLLGGQMIAVGVAGVAVVGVVGCGSILAIAGTDGPPEPDRLASGGASRVAGQ